MLALRLGRSRVRGSPSNEGLRRKPFCLRSSIYMDLESSLAQVRSLAGPLDDLAQIAQDRFGLRLVAHQDSLRPCPPPAQEPQDLLSVLVGQLFFVGKGLGFRVCQARARARV